ncbi:uncharacterized protein TNCV_3518301 [Trichonephila clavipes]|uniref:DNA helicase n=1 Tax=Trichonephila clavipes TaxID=2585209 RepID=A0A8X6STM8_TRICX|nr:uncharacterized protein TNCV_3518301 [Trichonephila clavipes]
MLLKTHLEKDYNKAIDLIDSLISVSAAEASDLILQKRKEFESNIDIEKTLQICRELCREEDADDGEDIRDVADDKIISVASDVITGCHNLEQENFVRQKLHKMKTDETGGLPYELILVLNRPYMITNNIDVADGLSNGTVGKLYHVERDENGDIIKFG